MKLLDIVNQLKLILPQYTDLFSNTQSISSITSTSSLATIITSNPHELTSGRAVTLSEVESLTAISAVSQDGLIFTFTTITDHDLTYGWEPHDTITFSGFTDSAWNSSFILTDVPNRRTFKVQSTNTIPTLNGSEKLHEIRIDGVNGQFEITVVDTTTFTIPGTFLTGTYVNGTVSTGVRVLGSVDIERSLEQYTKHGTSELWLFVSMSDVEVSKDRDALSDAIATPVNGTDIRIKLIDGFTLYVVVRTSDDITGAIAVDLCRHTLLNPIMKTIFGAKFTTGLDSSDEYRVVPKGMGVASYNKAVYVYAYEFEVSMDMTEEDAVEPRNTRAFRDIDYTQTIGTQDMTVNIDLDEEQL